MSPLDATTGNAQAPGSVCSAAAPQENSPNSAASHKMLDLEEAVRGHWALQNGIFGAVLSAPWGEVCAQQFCISLNGFVYKLVCFM